MGTYSEPKNQNLDVSGFENLHITDMELKEEWQDEEFPRQLSEETESHGEGDPTEEEERPAPPSSLALSGKRLMKKRLVAPCLSLTLERSDSVISEDFLSAGLSPDEDFDINIDELETPSDNESFTFPESMHELEWEDELPRRERSQEGSGAALRERERSEESQPTDEEDSQGRKWRLFRMGEQEYRVNMSVLEPYLRVLSHGGYYGDGLNAIIVFSSCYLPENHVENYEYIMDNLFRYVIGTLDLMVSENYILVYLNGMTPRNKIPSMGWLRQCYLTIDRRLRKNLKAFLVVHPSWYMKALTTIVRPFISAKFSRKLRFLKSLQELSELISMEHVHLPECIAQLDKKINSS
ncbi:bcl-2/adenovirus E1B 19 kDa-interacting protein 2-like protein isoform X2 [Acipenser oxyrinchus oxyrinchus]|uniref:Bcl-2/adenovirus E1B 19 kDa-interacting protein 2-like protein isoform X2 n=1 Tax=Acipenser oxyrinchus oxyrinchus TaxID=40147 RepID=A0AAD8CNA8_ACIOX|nr:bcl-2/adenovirus E1B 19 kDa-interacting protein 2-like protein isoform X2 [Acipenser oxyrinchus oxyrinchus]